ncbi:MAG: hypothetical protein K8S87_08055 [Planctomycetes bacterium]|nr:hypothetical protein [Planctomycetota bacterium]
MNRRIEQTFRLSHSIIIRMQKLFDLLTMFWVKRGLPVLTFLFALFLVAYCINDVNTKIIELDFAKCNVSFQHSQDESRLGDNGNNVLYFISTLQYQLSDSSSKNRKADSGRGFVRNFKISQQNFIRDLHASGFISTFQSRFRKTCPSEDLSL